MESLQSFTRGSIRLVPLYFDNEAEGNGASGTAGERPSRESSNPGQVWMVTCRKHSTRHLAYMKRMELDVYIQAFFFVCPTMTTYFFFFMWRQYSSFAIEEKVF
ncbi:hypothetical protein MLD38_014546 [Melastoma candidum]|uniref:Uncharacterized protein n=1 Tax=Melastoma candidum TaxID=119954 RepID=A0ACB9RCG7_9MYRT|nr:hypothetical protein MLD38_014546 [Melastoma candidum]